VFRASTVHHQEVKRIDVANRTAKMTVSELTVILDVPFATYTHLTSRRWAVIAETCRDILIQYTKNKQCIELVVIHIIHYARSTQHNIHIYIYIYIGLYVNGTACEVTRCSFVLRIFSVARNIVL
jgi:hypothetical protein